jgi:hypothetical protein
MRKITILPFFVKDKNQKNKLKIGRASGKFKTGYACKKEIQPPRYTSPLKPVLKSPRRYVSV